MYFANTPVSFSSPETGGSSYLRKNDSGRANRPLPRADASMLNEMGGRLNNTSFGSVFPPTVDEIRRE